MRVSVGSCLAEKYQSCNQNLNHDDDNIISSINSFLLLRFDLALISPRLLLLVLLMVMTCCHPTTSAASPGLMNNALLWKRLGLNRAIGDEGGQPQITSSKKKGESTVYLIKLPPQPHYYIPLNYLSAAGDKDSDEPSGAKKAISTPDPFETVLAVAAATAQHFTFFFF